MTFLDAATAVDVLLEIDLRFLDALDGWFFFAFFGIVVVVLQLVVEALLVFGGFILWRVLGFLGAVGSIWDVCQTRKERQGGA